MIVISGNYLKKCVGIKSEDNTFTYLNLQIIFKWTVTLVKHRGFLTSLVWKEINS